MEEQNIREEEIKQVKDRVSPPSQQKWADEYLLTDPFSNYYFTFFEGIQAKKLTLLL